MYISLEVMSRQFYSNTVVQTNLWLAKEPAPDAGTATITASVKPMFKYTIISSEGSTNPLENAVPTIE